MFAELDQLTEAVQRRAYEFFEGRGCALGCDFDDWLAAERELCGAEFEITEDEAGFRLQVLVGDFEPGDIEVTATPHELVVHARRNDKGRQELLRRVRLSTPVEVESVAATLKDGQLTLTAPKAELPAATVALASGDLPGAPWVGRDSYLRDESCPLTGLARPTSMRIPG